MVTYITDREGGGVLEPEKIDDKSGKTVINALRNNHPPMREPGKAAMHTYDTTPSLIDIDSTEDTVESIASKLSDSAGLRGTDSVQLKNLLLQHGGARRPLRQAVVAKFAHWMADTHAPWAAYRAECILAVACPSAKDNCALDQLCAGLSAGIEGAIHGMSQLWEKSEALDYRDFVLVDAKKAFSELNRINMLWTILHEWPAGARFTFNCYCHHGTLLCRASDGKSCTLHSKEGVTRGDPLSMF